ncbi:MAG: GNAT family N-acetyltransferase [Chloroflexi bacterium]|nr:GNAT family N-acetyltransferase [Chloroflexota bacterium]
MTLFRVSPVCSPAHEFAACYALVARVFAPDELVARNEYEHLLRRADDAAHPHRFAMLAAWDGDTLLGLIAGSTMTLDGDPSRCVGLIEYLAVAPDAPHHHGIGSGLLDAFEDAAAHEARARHESFSAIVGEVDEPLLPFKFAHGYRLAEGVRYAQPPIAFDAEGSALHPIVPKLLAIKPFALADPHAIDANLLESIVRTIVRWRYVPMFGAEHAKQRAAAMIDRDVVVPFVDSLGDRAAIPLIQYVAARP